MQTFGHMEFVLKHGKFRHLREVLEYPNSLRPIAADNGELGGGVAALVKEMIIQVKQGCWKCIWVQLSYLGFAVEWSGYKMCSEPKYLWRGYVIM